jgi:hypothetical protein
MQLKIGKAQGRDFSIDAQELVTGRTCIIAQSGAGKSWSIAVLCETMCRAKIGFCLIDTEGEYYSLKEKFPDILWIGAEGADADVDDIGLDYDIEKINIKQLVSKAVSESRPIIFDVSEVDMVPRVTRLAHVLYDVASEQKKPYLLIVEEADKFIPQSRDSIKKIEEISRRGRKRGLGLLVATQRPAIVTKNVLSQCNNQIIGKLSIDNDLKAVGIFFSSKQEVEELTTLNPGDFFVMGSLAHEKTKIQFGKRQTKHRGVTPLLEEREIVEYFEEEEEEEEEDIAIYEDAGRITRPDKQEDDEEDEKISELPEILLTDRPEGEQENNDFQKEEDNPKTHEIKEENKPKPKPAQKKSAGKKVTRRTTKSPEEAVINLIERDEAFEIAGSKLRRKRFGFGSGERLISGNMVYIPLFHVSVKYIRGRFRKTTQHTSFVIDGVKGRCVDTAGGLKFRPCFSDYIGLDENSIKVLNVMSFSGETVADLEGMTRLKQSLVKSALSGLEERKMVTISDTVGESDEPVYVPLITSTLPKLGTRQRNFDFRTGTLNGEKWNINIKEGDIRTILKALEPTSEIVEFRLYYYPLFEIKAGSDLEERTLYIDALSGKEVIIDV